MSYVLFIYLSIGDSAGLGRVATYNTLTECTTAGAQSVVGNPSGILIIPTIFYVCVPVPSDQERPNAQ